MREFNLFGFFRINIAAIAAAFAAFAAALAFPAVASAFPYFPDPAFEAVLRDADADTATIGLTADQVAEFQSRRAARYDSAGFPTSVADLALNC